jgi:hypothetical protein
MSEFSDDDLKRLKGAMTANSPTGYWFPHNNLEALLARLEASTDGFLTLHAEEMCRGCKCRLCEAWRKAAGK